MLADILMGNFDPMYLLVSIMSSLVVIFLTLPIHEWAHGFVATKLGDPTPRYQGRLTLNPFAHIDYFGALCILLFGVGWAKPVQINPRNFKNEKIGMAITALAGPTSNVVVATISIFLANLVCALTGCEFTASGTVYYMPGSEIWAYVILFLTGIASINIALAVFNMIPIPPFDGSRIMFAVLPDRIYWRVMEHERILMFVVLIIIATGALDIPLAIANNFVFGLINGISKLLFVF